ncbi:MAG: isopentenyl-diphosphate Delta-isomerase [Hyphomicrobium sp.]
MIEHASAAAAEDVVLVDADDREIGREEKLSAHRRGALHRAFSVMIWDSRGRMLLQQRASGKYHSGGLWTNACCGHPRPGETAINAAARRLVEEMGVEAALTPLGNFTYRAQLDQGLVEHEFVHVFRGAFAGRLRPDPAECDGYAWAPLDWIIHEAAAKPERFTEWFKKYLAVGWPVAAS